MAVTLDNVLASTFGEATSDITATFKKTVLVRQYETEVVEMTSTVHFEKPLTSAERVLLSALLEIQLEYTAYVNLVGKGYITATEFNERRAMLEKEINDLKNKAESVLQKPLDKYFETTF